VPEFRTLLEILSAVLVPVATLFYILGILRGTILPTKATWLVWTVLSTLLTLSMYEAGTLNLQILSTTGADVVVLVLTLRYGKAWAWSTFDVACIVLAGTSIALWQSTGDPLWGVVFNSLAVVLGSFPLFKEVWLNPEVEKPLPWILMMVSSICILVALRQWSIESAAQPLIYLFVPGVVVALTLFPARPQLAKF